MAQLGKSNITYQLVCITRSRYYYVAARTGLIAKPDFGFNITKYVKQEIRKQKKKAIPASKYYNQLAYSFHGTKK